ncbi:MAG: hypothetical protein WA581_03370 [Candidatus Acidiferrales bacterium]
MPASTPTESTLDPGLTLFALAIIALGAQNVISAKDVTHAMGPGYNVLPVLPFLPSIPWLAYVFGAVWVVLGAGLLFKRTLLPSALALGTILFLCAVILEAPKNAAAFRDVGLRTGVFEPLSMAGLAWLLPGAAAIPRFLALAARWIFAVSLVIFGVDHFLVFRFIVGLVPSWIPWHAFWSAFFGVAFIAAGMGIALTFLARWSYAGIALMFGIWVVTLHLPRVLGLYGIPGAPHSPAEWSSLFIAVSFCGGPWSLARRKNPPA